MTPLSHDFCQDITCLLDITWLPLSHDLLCHMTSIITWPPLSHDFQISYDSNVTWLPLSHDFLCHMTFFVTWLPDITWLHCHMISIITWPPLSHDFQLDITWSPSSHDAHCLVGNKMHPAYPPKELNFNKHTFNDQWNNHGPYTSTTYRKSVHISWLIILNSDITSTTYC